MKTIDYSKKVLEVKNLKKYFYVGVGKNRLKVPAVDDVTFDVYKREVFGLVGESGCGKTTTGRTLIKLYNPTDGTVTFNGVKVAAGYRTHTKNISRIKHELEHEIYLLTPYGHEVNEIKRKFANKKIQLKDDLEKALINRKEQLQKAKQPVLDYENSVYVLKNEFVIESEALKYEFITQKDELISKTQNPSSIEFENHLKMVKLSYSRKVEGIKDSAALSKSVRSEKRTQLKTEFNEAIKALEDKYAESIRIDEANKMDIKQVKGQIKELYTKFKLDIKALKSKLSTDIKSIQKPNIVEIRANKIRVFKSQTQNIAAIRKQIKQIQLEEKDAIKGIISKYQLTSDQKAKISEEKKRLIQEAKAKIDDEKSAIRLIRNSNKSTEGLVESRKMQMIFQDPISSLNPRMTVKEIIAEGLTIQGNLSKDEIDAKVKETLQLVGLAPDYATRYPHEFSGGQRQRIGIARALIMNPGLIIADEPISALDVSIRAQVINLLTKLKEDLDLTIVFIAHDLSVVRFFCDRIAVMYRGKIVELATSEELFRKPMHPYTVSLLSAIPQPDPDYEKGRQRISYNPSMHNYLFDKPSLKEIAPGHLVYVNNQEFNVLKEKYNNK